MTELHDLSLSDVCRRTKSGELTAVRVTEHMLARIAAKDPALRAFVRVVLDGAVRPAAMVVPLRSVLEGPQGKFVYVVNAESKAEPRPVEVGDWTAGGWIINKGLQLGERVIVDGVMKLGPGAPVKVAGDAAAPGAPAGKKASPGVQTPAGK